MRHIYSFINIKLKRRLNGRYSLKSDQIETYYQTEVYSHSYQNHVIQNFSYIKTHFIKQCGTIMTWKV